MFAWRVAEEPISGDDHDAAQPDDENTGAVHGTFARQERAAVEAIRPIDEDD
jgi:hypothetical protein